MKQHNLGTYCAICTVCCLLSLACCAYVLFGNMINNHSKKPVSKVRLAEEAFIRAFPKEWPECEVIKVVFGPCKDPVLFRGDFVFKNGARSEARAPKEVTGLGNYEYRGYAVVRFSGNEDCFFDVYKSEKAYLSKLVSLE